MIYDISLPLSPDLPVWPGDPIITCEEVGGDGVAVSRWTLGSHSGTHVDAPRHFLPGGATMDQLDPEVLIGPCRVIEIPDIAMITAELLPDFVGVTRVLFRTRNSLRRRRHHAQFDSDFTALAMDAAEVLLAHGVRLIGTDGPSIEAFGGDGSVHRRVLGAGSVLLENLDLADVPAGGYQLFCAPLRLLGADGAPARAFLVR